MARTFEGKGPQKASAQGSRPPRRLAIKGQHAPELASDNLVYLVVALFSVLLVIVYAAGWLASYPIANMLVKELGAAGLVAMFLVFTIERITRRRHQRAADELMEKINTDIFRAVYKRRVPEPVFVEFERLLLTTNVYRTGLEVIYILQSLDDVDAREADPGGDYLRCTIQSSFELRNLTENDISHPIYLFLDAPPASRFADLCGIDQVKLDGTALSSETIAQHLKPTEGGSRFNYRVEIPAGASVRIATTVHAVKPAINTEVWISSYPSDGLILTVTTIGISLDVTARAAHTQRLDQEMNNAVTRRWTLRRGLLPSQSVYFWWKPSAPIPAFPQRGKG